MKSNHAFFASGVRKDVEDMMIKKKIFLHVNEDYSSLWYKREISLWIIDKKIYLHDDTCNRPKAERTK